MVCQNRLLLAYHRVDKRLCKERNFTETITNPACGLSPPTATLTPSRIPHLSENSFCFKPVEQPIESGSHPISSGIVTVGKTGEHQVLGVFILEKGMCVCVC